jgi:hypothetical protein
MKRHFEIKMSPGGLMAEHVTVLGEINNACRSFGKTDYCRQVDNTTE